MSPATRPNRPGTAWMLRSLTAVLLAMYFLTVPAAASSGIRSQEWPLDAQHLQSAKAWNITRGRGVTVAVVDSGVDAGHPDLTGQVLPGASFLGDAHDDGRSDTSKDSHGTAISGIIAGTGKSGDGTGMIGLAPDARILPVRVGVDASVQPTALAEGIKYAADRHAQVINISMGIASPDPLVRQAVAYALDHDAVVVAAAGNEGQNGNPPQYPAAFQGVVDVTGITQSGDFWPVSGSGPGTTLAGPAVGIYSTNDRGQYVDAEGTSYAAAYVSAVAALVRSAHPDLTAGQTIRRLITTAHRNGGHGHDDRLGYGIVAPLAALTASATVDGEPDNPLLTSQVSGSATAHGHQALEAVGISAGSAVATAAIIATVLWRKRISAAKDGVTGRASSANARPSSRSKAAPKGISKATGTSPTQRPAGPRQKKSRGVTSGRR